MPGHDRCSCSMEGLELVCLHRSFILVEVSKWVLCAIVVGIIVSVDGLSLQAGDSVELLDGSSSETSKRTEHSTLNLCNLCILDSVHKGVLCLGGVVLELFGSIFLAERSYLVKVLLEVVGHFLRQVIFRRTVACRILEQSRWHALVQRTAICLLSPGTCDLQCAGQGVSKGVAKCCLLHIVAACIAGMHLVTSHAVRHRCCVSLESFARQHLGLDCSKAGT
mmetsp:Transcript_31404/g.71708  ORF Transcript_31404/g.71708 Transcript_31404/m.71708 type:complete len:222 (-) Transcript_31404:292-957(-)